MSSAPSAEPTSGLAGRRVAASTAVTAASQILTMGIGALMAILVLLEFGKTAETDGFFAAYGVYGVVLVVAQSLRTTIVSRIVEAGSKFGALDRYLQAAVGIFLLSAVPLVVLGSPVAQLLTGGLDDRAASAARDVLALLWLASGGQLAAAMGAAALAERQQFGLPALAYVIGGVLSVSLLLVLEGPIGILAAPTGIAAGSMLTAAVILVRLRLLGWRPGRERGQYPMRIAAAAAQMVTGALGFVIWQFTFVISLGFAARTGVGQVTLYSYAFTATSFVISSSTAPLSVVVAAPLSAAWDRRPDSLMPYVLGFVRAGTVFALPIFAAAALLGDELVELVLGSSLAAGDPDLLIRTFLALAGIVLLSVMGTAPVLAAFALGRYREVALAAAAGTVAHVAFNLVALEVGTLEAVALAASASAVVLLVLYFRLVFGKGALGAAAQAVRATLAAVGVAAASYGVPWALASWIGISWADSLAMILGSLAFPVLVRLVLPSSWSLIRQALGGSS